MATSGHIMQQINPVIFDSANKAGSVERLIEADGFLNDKCQELNEITTTQFHLPNQLRSQRFKD